MSRWTTKNLKKEIVSSLSTGPLKVIVQCNVRFNDTIKGITWESVFHLGTFRLLHVSIKPRNGKHFATRSLLGLGHLGRFDISAVDESVNTSCVRNVHLGRFDISAVDESVNTSYVRNVHVKYCGKTYPDLDTVRFKFAIKTTGFRCQPEKASNGR